jgi:hypothetical protein
MCTEAVAVVRAVGADFFLDRWHVEIVSDNSIRRPRSDVGLSTGNVPGFRCWMWCTNYMPKSFQE